MGEVGGGDYTTVTGALDVICGASPHPSSSFLTVYDDRPNAALYQRENRFWSRKSTTEGEIGGPRFERGEVSNLDMISEYFDPEESATFLMIVAGSISASLLAVI